VSRGETQPRKTKLVNLNTTQNQPHNHPIARPIQKGTSCPVCHSTWSTGNFTGCPSTLASSLKLPPSPLKLLIPVILHILPACSTGTPHVEPYDPPQLICCQSRDVTCHSVVVSSSAPTIWNSLPANVRSSATLSTFRRHLKSHLFQSSFPTA